MPKLWTETIETHRREVRDAIVATTAELVGKHGLPAVTMARIAQATGIGRATLYNYFPDVVAILEAWHERHVTRHLEHLTAVRDRHTDPRKRLAAVLEAFAQMAHERSREHQSGHARHGHADRAPGGHAHGMQVADFGGLVRHSEHVDAVQRRLKTFFGDLIEAAVRSGDARADVPPDELATYCLHALHGASDLKTKAEISRLVALTLGALLPLPGTSTLPRAVKDAPPRK